MSNDIFSRNGKMNETEKKNPETRFFNFNLQARITCTQMGECEKFCYARQGRYVFPSVIAKQKRNLALTKRLTFEMEIGKEIDILERRASKKGKICYFRIHDSGDYYNKEYAKRWFTIAREHPNSIFYSYTKCVQMFHDFEDANEIPDNFAVIMSYGGKQDDLIRDTDRKAKVFQSADVIPDGWVDATGNDLIAIMNKNIALPYHGSKKVKICN